MPRRTQEIRERTGPSSSEARARPGGPISLVLVDPNRLMREDFSERIQEQPCMRLVAALDAGAQALQRVREARPKVVLVNFGLEDFGALHLTSALHSEAPEVKIIVMGLHSQQKDVVDFVRAGTSGFIMNDAPFEDFVSTIRSVAEGSYVLPPQLTAFVFRWINDQSAQRGLVRPLSAVNLTNRERQVINLICEGHSNKEIAAALDIAVHTVKSHVHNVLEKLSLHSRLEIATLVRTQETGRPTSDDA